MEAVSISETSVNFYETTRRNIPQDSHLQEITFLIANETEPSTEYKSACKAMNAVRSTAFQM
jgi:hypothetical protein